ncbi:MAG: gfo/Idh/MocA family oxidoreductase, partial [Verrucomicrobia bacterium]|nr:gfo/Idh/MocA family oxidoreductase [Verrucomicrobiota bacterium]
MFPCTADDAAYALFETDTGVICQFNSSWAVRVRRDDLLTLQVDGTEGSAVVGLRKCRVQHASATPRPVWNPDIDSPLDHYDGWSEVADSESCDNAFKIQWEMFLRHVVADEPFPWTLAEGARGVELAELSWLSHRTGAWVDVP